MIDFNKNERKSFEMIIPLLFLCEKISQSANLNLTPK
jgi:hypothetical protein